MPPLLLAILAALAIFVIWNACQDEWQIEISIDPETGTEIRGAPNAKELALREFFEHDVTLEDPLKVLVRRIPPDRFVTKFVGKIDPGRQQRIRNFLMDRL